MRRSADIGWPIQVPHHRVAFVVLREKPNVPAHRSVLTTMDATILCFGALSDRVGRRPVYLAGSAFVALFAFPFFWMLNTKSTILIWLAIILSTTVGIYAMFSPQAAYFAELFDTRVRYSGIAFAREISAPLAGGIAPFVATALLSWTGSYWAVAVYIIVLALITVVSIYLGPETYRRGMTREEVREAEAVRPEPAS